MSDEYSRLHERALETERRLKRISYKKQYDLRELLEECSELFQQLAPFKRKAFLTHIIQELHDKQKGICPLCKKSVSLDEFDVDHIIPWHWGGGNERGNLQITHASCNRSKGKKIEDIHKLVNYLEDRIMNL